MSGLKLLLLTDDGDKIAVCIKLQDVSFCCKLKRHITARQIYLL